MNFDTNLPFEWFILLLRILFVFLLYFFLFQIVRTVTRELRAVSLATSGGRPPLAEEAPRTAQLVVEDAQEAGFPPGTAFTLRPGATVGRRRGSDLHFNDTFMSGEHARVTVQDGRWWIADLGSTNGTFVDGRRIDRPTPLNDGAEVRFGRIRMRFIG